MEREVLKSSLIKVVFEALFIISFLALFWTYLGYPSSLYLLSFFYKVKGRKADDGFTPNVSIMIMTYNEAKVIEEKLVNTLSLDYPKDRLEILVVDSGSTDGTEALVKKYFPQGVKLVEEGERRGKASAINLGLNHASGDVVMITDANTFLAEDCLRRLVKHFADEKVGGVSGRFVPITIENGLASKGESLYWQVEGWMKEKESLLDSPSTLVGPITVIRRDVIEKVDEESITEDFEISVAIRGKGYKLVYEPDAKGYEAMPQNISDLIKQKERITIGTLRTLAKYRKILFNPKYGLYGSLILPSHKFLQTLTPFFLIILSSTTIILNFYSSSPLFSLAFYLLAATVLLFLASLIASILPLPANMKSFFNALSYFILLQAILISGWKSYLTGKHQIKWEKIESARIPVKC